MKRAHDRCREEIWRIGCCMREGMQKIERSDAGRGVLANGEGRSGNHKAEIAKVKRRIYGAHRSFEISLALITAFHSKTTERTTLDAT